MDICETDPPVAVQVLPLMHTQLWLCCTVLLMGCYVLLQPASHTEGERALFFHWPVINIVKSGYFVIFTSTVVRISLCSHEAISQSFTIFNRQASVSLCTPLREWSCLFFFIYLRLLSVKGWDLHINWPFYFSYCNPCSLNLICGHVNELFYGTMCGYLYGIFECLLSV